MALGPFSRTVCYIYVSDIFYKILVFFYVYTVPVYFLTKVLEIEDSNFEEGKHNLNRNVSLFP
jgi:hypothetical protein